MRWLMNHRPQPATIIATMALIVSLSGVAAAQVGMIGPNQIRNGSIQTRHLAANAVTGPKIAANAVGTADVAPESLRSNDLQDGSIHGDDIGGETITDLNLTQASLTYRVMAPLPAVTVTGTPPDGVGLGSIGACDVFSPLWRTEVNDYAGMHTDTFGNGQAYLDAPIAGRYRISATLVWDNVGGGSRYVDFQVVTTEGGSNQSMGGAGGPMPAVGGLTQNLAVEVIMEAGGRVSLSGARCNFTGSPSLSTTAASRFQMTYLGPT